LFFFIGSDIKVFYTLNDSRFETYYIRKSRIRYGTKKNNG